MRMLVKVVVLAVGIVLVSVINEVSAGIITDNGPGGAEPDCTRLLDGTPVPPVPYGEYYTDTEGVTWKCWPHGILAPISNPNQD